MIGGVALLGVVTGVVASWFVEKIRGVELSIEESTYWELRAVCAELAALRARLYAESRRTGDVDEVDSVWLPADSMENR
jgi:voltage-gated potassium channel